MDREGQRFSAACAATGTAPPPRGSERVKVVSPSCVPHHYIFESSNPTTPRFRGLGFPKTLILNPYSPYMVTSLIRNSAPLGPYSTPMSRALRKS